MRNSFADLLREWRARSGLTQQELADTVGIGRNTVVRYESGGVPRSHGVLVDLADLLTRNEEERERFFTSAYRQYDLNRDSNQHIPEQPKLANYINKEEDPFAHLLFSFQPETFVGRKFNIRNLLLGVTSREPRSFCLVGIRTIGKTTLLKFLCHPQGVRLKYREELERFSSEIYSIHFLYINSYRLNGLDLLWAIYDGLHREGLIKENVLPKDIIEPDKIMSTLMSNLRNIYYEQNTRIVICLDHFDKTYTGLSPRIEGFFRVITNYHSLILAIENSLSALRKDNYTSPLFNIITPIRLGLLLKEEAKELITIPSSSVEFTEIEITFLLETGGGNPYLLTVVCDLYVKLRDSNPRFDEIIGNKINAQEYILIHIENHIMVQELFAFFWKECISERDILYKIVLDQEVTSESELRAVQVLLSKSLIYEDLQNRRYHIFSKLFAIYVQRMYNAAL